MAEIPYKTEPLPIVGQYNVQRFKQFSPEDCANFYVVKGENTKRPFALYPTLGRNHINYLGQNKLIFAAESRGLFRSVKYWYNVVGNSIYRIDKNYNEVEISNGVLRSTSGNIFFASLVVNTITFACFVDNQKIYIYQEDSGSLQEVTDPNAPGNLTVNGVLTKPGFIIAFGNRIAVSVAGSSQFFLSVINLLTVNTGLSTSSFNPLYCFSIGASVNPVVNGAAVFAQENGIIKQFGVLNNTLYIFTDFTTGVWANIPAIFSGTGVSFPWKKNSTYDWNFGIADPASLDINFGRMTFLGQNANGLLQVMATSGGEPERISSKAIDVLFQRYANSETVISPFLSGNAEGFLYQYENTIFYRISGGSYNGNQLLDHQDNGSSIEYNFETKTWSRVIELNGERCRVQRHVFFNGKHLVSVKGEGTVYEMSGKYYQNEVRDLTVTNPQSDNAYVKYPFRYERITPIICEDDEGEFETLYAQIDFVFGESDIAYSTTPFENAIFIVDQVDQNGEPVYTVTEDTEPKFIISEEGNTPQLYEKYYNKLFKPHVELYWSDDGGVSFHPASQIEFAQMGYYQWRMRWYELGTSRNRVYKLIAVSPVPIVILGATMCKRRVSGGGN
jgi:hypothetical protein